jgi:hypothetical protein
MHEDTAKIVAVCVLGVLLLVMGWAPGHIARHRGHPSKDAINLCGWLGLFIPILWLVAAIWAHTGPDRSKHPPATRPARRRHRLTRRQWDAVEALEEMA